MASYEERQAEMQVIYDDKIEAFKEALKLRCETDGVPYQCIKEGQREVFAVGGDVFQIMVTDTSIHWELVGKMYAG